MRGGVVSGRPACCRAKVRKLLSADNSRAAEALPSPAARRAASWVRNAGVSIWAKACQSAQSPALSKRAAAST